MGANVKGISLMPNTRPNHFDLLENNMETDIIDITFFERLKKSILDYLENLLYKVKIFNGYYMYNYSSHFDAQISLQNEKLMENQYYPYFR